MVASMGTKCQRVNLVFLESTTKNPLKSGFLLFFADSAPVTNGGLKIQTGLFA